MFNKPVYSSDYIVFVSDNYFLVSGLRTVISPAISSVVTTPIPPTPNYANLFDDPDAEVDDEEVEIEANDDV